MSSTVHYKFRSVNDLKVINFDGASIAVSELVQQICSAEKINMQMFDLKLSSANNNQYEPNGTVPKNTMVIIQRVPAQNAKKAPKTSNAEFPTTSNATSKAVAHINSEAFSKMSESERLQHALLQSTYKYDPSTYSRKPTSKKAVAKVPESYQCSRCYEFGAHFTANCPLVGIRSTHGIPSSELIETTADDADRMLHTNGKWYITKMVQRTREQKKQRDEQRRLGVVEQTPLPTMATAVPDDLKCHICHDLYKDAVILQCGDSFCGDCIYENVKTAALNDQVCLCPLCQKDVRINDLLPNAALRKSVDAFKKGPSSEVSNSPSSNNTTSFDDTSKSAPSNSTTPPPSIKTKQPVTVVNLCHLVQQPHITKLTALPTSENTSTASSPSQTCSESSESAPTALSTTPPPTVTQDILQLPPVNLCHLFQPKPVPAIVDTSIPPPQFQSIPSESVSIDISSESEPESCYREFAEYDARDMEVIETAWRLVPTFEYDIDLMELVYVGGQKMPKLVRDIDDKKNRRESRKRSRVYSENEYKNSKYSKRNRYYC